MTSGVLLALSGAVEEELVARIARRPDLQVVRRCADTAELVAAAVAGLGRVAVLDDEDAIDRRMLARLRSAGVAALVLCESADCDRYSELGAMAVPHGVDPLPAIEALAGGATNAPVPDEIPEPVTDPGEVSPPALSADPRVVAVTGAPGAPGRTSMAIALADELAATGASTVLIDADLWGGSIAQTLGLMADSAGLSAAIRAADRGSLDDAALDRLLLTLPDGLRVLTGLARAARWREVGPDSMEVLLERARKRAAWVVVEVPVLVPDDEGLELGPGRNAVAHSVLAAAQDVLVVGAAEPIGIQRLVQTLLDLQDVPGIESRRTIVNRLRLSAAGPQPDLSVREALGRFAGVPDPILVPDDRALADRAVLTGTTWRKAGPLSPARTAVRDLARMLLAEAGQAEVTGRRRERWRTGRRGRRRGGERRAD
ncbi:AAA family ATPase [Ruania alba]|uniref:Flp pilus assembly protein, ATPase CpaE n=1 Tax=Ruania alba TaxID=648782 RepID=A0A1H5NC98_9MICO|nr:hypothetical protein [Ruania alba]SEE99185.1 Flp pilus assembly protein, ATPase CpaE [Ruania alba]